MIQTNRRRFIQSAGAAAAIAAVPLRGYAKQTTTLHLSHIFNLEDLRHKASVAFAEEVKAKTNGEGRKSS